MHWWAGLYRTSYVAGSTSSQISVVKSTRHRQSQRSDAGDGHKTAVVTSSSVSRWQQFTTSVRSAAYLCLVTCPAGMFLTPLQTSLWWNVGGMLFCVFYLCLEFLCDRPWTNQSVFLCLPWIMPGLQKMSLGKHLGFFQHVE